EAIVAIVAIVAIITIIIQNNNAGFEFKQGTNLEPSENLAGDAKFGKQRNGISCLSNSECASDICTNGVCADKTNKY
ncbi:hypothetical protein K9M18_01205, partial [Candidatus Woesearchaeota archaeon]|nr:hypothetical protein [Candidatus Woesearchaeota archaeon]